MATQSPGHAEEKKIFWHKFLPWLGSGAISLLLLAIMLLFLNAKIQSIYETDRLRATAFGKELIGSFDKELGTLINLSSGPATYIRVSEGKPDAGKLLLFLKEIRGNTMLIRNIGVAKGTVLRYMEPLEGNEKAVGVDYRLVPEQWSSVEKAITLKKGILNGPVELIQGGQALIYRLPIFVNDEYWGMISSVINVDALFDAAFAGFASRNWTFAIRLKRPDLSNKGNILFGDGSLFESDNIILLDADVPSGKWEYVIKRAKHSPELAIIRNIEGAGILIIILLFFLFSHLLRLRQQNREAIRKIELSEAWLSTIVNTTLSGFAIFDRDGYLTWTNESSKEIHGYHVEDVIGKHFYVFTYPEDQMLGSQIIEKIVTGEVQYFDGEFRIMHKETGKVIWIHVIATPFPKNIRSDKERILLYYQNITKQKEYETELKALNATKDKFFSIIAHDLRNPFVALLGLSELVLAKYNSITEEDRRKKLEMMHESARLTYELLENLLAWSLSQSGGIVYKPARISLSNMLANTANLYQASADSKNIRLINMLTKKCFVYADKFMLETILRSLISNAIKFTHRNGEVTIGVNEENINGFAEVFVHDNGVGISPETLDELFRIDRKNTTQGTEKEKGSGLGLILCKEFVEKHGGKIRAENNTSGKGCRFTFTIPANAPAG